MKQVVVSGVFFVLIIAALIFNSFYLHDLTSEMFEYIDALPAQIDGSDSETVLKLHELTDFWVDRREIVSLTVNYDYNRQHHPPINSVRELYENGQPERVSFGENYALYESVWRLHELEKPTLSNII